MRTAKRVIAATALGLPLLLGAPGMAMADGGHHHKKPSQSQEQDQENSTEQGNKNASPIYQWSVGSKGDQAAQTWNHQSNDNETEQDQDASQED